MAGDTVATSVREKPVTNASWLDKWRWYERNTSKEEKVLLRKLVGFGFLALVPERPYSL